MQPVLVVLAAGFGRRFGGDKQLSAVGPGGRPLIAYALHDARRAGFGRAVVVVREGLAARLDPLLAGAGLPVEYALQAGDREHPWGTGHAVLAAAGAVDGPFMVVNADDFYGAGTYRAMAEFLSGTIGEVAPIFGLGAFPLAATLSAGGPVNRGICRVRGEWLDTVEEVRGIPPDGGSWPPETPVSLNAWGFSPSLFPMLAEGFEAFRETAGAEDEFMLPAVVNRLVAEGRVRVRLVAAPGPWIGVTWPADLPVAAAHLARITAAGEYPAFG